MPARIFNLKDAPDDERQDVRTLLEANNIHFYETPAGKWGISVPAFWLKDDNQFDEARSLIDAYQSERMVRIQEEYRQRVEEGNIETLVGKLKNDPLKFVFILVIILFIAYVSIKPFIDLGLKQ